MISSDEGFAPVESPQDVVPAQVDAAPVATNPVEEAATNFTQLLPYVKKLCANMSAKAQARVHHAMAEFPLGATKPRLIGADEKQLFQVLQHLQGFKSTILQSFIREQAEANKLKETAVNATVEKEKEDGGN